ncbi:hypothetical protein PJL18_03730 [Paenarthrobacter nicotinovorans]|nr:hypothetical protein [Paenarthrobacter nicotinovorans]MDI2023182.1 hypothetical protein [Paenarthrobacter nicotinovorans]
MAITGRFVVLALAGLVPLVLFPSWPTVLLVCVVLVLALVLDLLLAASPAKLVLARLQPGNVTLAGSAESVVSVTNATGRKLNAVIRDAWPELSKFVRGVAACQQVQGGLER